MASVVTITVDDPSGVDTSFMFPGDKAIEFNALGRSADGKSGNLFYYEVINGVTDTSVNYRIAIVGNNINFSDSGLDLYGEVLSLTLYRNGVQAAHMSFELDPRLVFGAPITSLANLTPNALLNQFTGFGGAPLELFGDIGADKLGGSDRADLLDGGANADTMTGQGGDDLYSVDDVGDRVVELAGEGVDTVQSTISYTLANGLENLTLLGTGALRGTGNSAANVLTGNAGRNTLTGLAGDDTYFIGSGDVVVEAAAGGTDTVHTSVTYTAAANVENVTLEGVSGIGAKGNALANVLTGNSNRNRLEGLAGNDTYYVTAGDVVVEAANGGTDTVFSGVSFTLAANVERLTLEGSGDANGTGNAAANTLTGNAGKNVLNGGGGADVMAGGLGDDTYVTDGGDRITENANSGIDTVQSSVTLTLGANFENLTLTGSAAINGAGNALANTLTGNRAVNTLSGGANDDNYFVQTVGDRVVEGANAGSDAVYSTVTFTLGANVEALVLNGAGNINGTGNTLANAITGNTGANRIEGGAGADILTGLAGVDTFVFHAGSGADQINDFNPTAGAGHDLIQFDRTQYADFAAVMAYASAPAGDQASLTVISDGTDSVTLFVQRGLLTADDFIFV